METNDLVKWLTGDSELGNGGGFIEKLKVSPDGLDGIADGIATFVGENGDGGLLKCFQEYDQECTLNLGDFEIALEAEAVIGGQLVKMPLKVKMGDGSNPFFEDVFKKMLLAYLLQTMMK